MRAMDMRLGLLLIAPFRSLIDMAFR